MKEARGATLLLFFVADQGDNNQQLRNKEQQ
jgi:hypothetical protein